eukprot:Nk52_evm58s270 gene=Nk52_evmTU58s270
MIGGTKMNNCSAVEAKMPTENLILLGDIVDKHCERGLGKELCVSFKGKEHLTFDEQRQLTDNIGGAIQALLRPGDMFSFLIPDGVDVFTLFMSAAKAGSVAVPVNWKNVAREVEGIILHAQPRLFVISESRMNVLSLADLDASGIDFVVIQGDLGKYESMTTEHGPMKTKRRVHKCDNISEVLELANNDNIVKVLSLDLLKTKQPECPLTKTEDTSIEDVVAILYTSGSTGNPKGVAHTHKSLNYLGWSMGNYMGLYEDIADMAMMFCGPSHHVGGLGTFLGAHMRGITYHNSGLCSIDEIADMVNALKPTNLLALTAQYQLLLNSDLLTKEALDRIVYGAVGGDIVGKVLKKVFKEKTTAELRVGYGMTELLMLTSNHSSSTDDLSIGKVWADCDIKVVDDKGNPLPPGVIGEIWVKSPYMFKEYFKNPVENSKAFEDGYFKTGDCAKWDDKGSLWFCGRQKHVVKYMGFQIYISEIEDALSLHPEVDECAVVGKCVDTIGELPCAFISLKAKNRTTASKEKEIIKYLLDGMLAEFRVPRRVFILDSIPKGKSGKLDRLLLKKMLNEEMTELVTDSFQFLHEE